MKYTDIPYFFVFDVESVGLHGEAFAVGYTVVDREGKEEDAALLATPFQKCKGTLEDFGWIEKHCDNLPTNIRAADLRDNFWEAWIRWKTFDAVMAADVNWPVESKFLSECVNADHGDRAWLGPYPLIDVASVLLAKGYDPTATYRRLERELPEHNPLADARQSARLLTMALRGESLTFNP